MPKASKKPSPRAGHVRLTVVLTPAQYAAVVKAAMERALASGALRADLSGVVREALDLWLTKQRKG